MLLEFEGGLELRVGRDKGGAIDTLIAEAPPGTPVAYVGDDLTDEAAFRALSQRGKPAPERADAPRAARNRRRRLAAPAFRNPHVPEKVVQSAAARAAKKGSLTAETAIFGENPIT